ncbi:hypothetical protein KSP40_PGU008868 [Platanthera guangdongensis]|uniref:Uncharacterized protein n=1 Tax=Platanthera guangdongensis TaxID=2320717 RepID=A0ABR2N0N4_9ASPA
MQSQWAFLRCRSSLLIHQNITYTQQQKGSPVKERKASLTTDHDQSRKVFSPSVIPSLSHLNLKGNCLDSVTPDDLLILLNGFTHLQELEVDIPGPLGNSAVRILESLPKLSLINGINASSIIENGKHVVDSALKPRLPIWTSSQTLADRVISAMWLYLMTYRLADEEKIDETSVWYVH